jgi:hypothetical protein
VRFPLSDRLGIRSFSQHWRYCLTRSNLWESPRQSRGLALVLVTSMKAHSYKSLRPCLARGSGLRMGEAGGGDGVSPSMRPELRGRPLGDQGVRGEATDVSARNFHRSLWLLSHGGWHVISFSIENSILFLQIFQVLDPPWVPCRRIAPRIERL